MKKLFLASCCVMLLTGVSFARNGTPKKSAAPRSAASQQAGGNIGVGFNSQLSRAGLNSLAVRAWLSDTLGVEGMLGFAFGDDRSLFDLGGKVLGVIRKEQNLSLYGFGLLGIESSSVKNNIGQTTSETSVAFGGGLGVEFFLQGLPNLGFGTEVGLGYNSGSKQFGTLADWITSVGMRYYF